MRVTFHRSGGFIGFLQTWEFDTELMDADEAQKLELLISASGIQDERVMTNTIIDGYCYCIYIQDGFSKIKAYYDTGAIMNGLLSEGMVNLIRYLEGE